MTNPITGTNGPVSEWVAANQAKENDELTLSNTLADLKGSVDQIFMLMMLLVLPDAGRVREDDVKIASSELNTSNVISGILTKITTDLNGIKASNTITPGQPGSNNCLAADMLKQIGYLQAAWGTSSADPGTPSVTWTNPDTGKQETQSWISGSTLSTVRTSLDAFANLVGNNPGIVVQNLLQWTSHPTSGAPSGQENIQSLNSSAQTSNEAIGGLTQVASNNVSFDMNLTTQLQSCTKTMLSDIATMVAAFTKKTGNG